MNILMLNYEFPPLSSRDIRNRPLRGYYEHLDGGRRHWNDKTLVPRSRGIGSILRISKKENSGKAK